MFLSGRIPLTLSPWAAVLNPSACLKNQKKSDFFREENEEQKKENY